MCYYQPDYVKLIEYERNGLCEQVHNGIILHCNKNGIIKKAGEDNKCKFYHRSCMKPLQAAVFIDLGLDKTYALTDEEIAVCCGSHCGDSIPQEKVLSVLNKIGCSEEDLFCPAIAPLSKKEKERLFVLNLPYRKVHNNCSGKHALMLAICKYKGFNIKNYTDLTHPLTELVLNKVCNLCNTDIREVKISKDGCGLPVIATTLEQLGMGFLNLFTNDKYKRIKNAFLKYPYLIGGEGRLDSEIINISDNLISKVGACGLCVVVNLDKEECLVVKIADSGMEARSITVIEALLQLKWPDVNKLSSGTLNNIYIKKIKTQDGEILGEIHPCFSIS